MKIINRTFITLMLLLSSTIAFGADVPAPAGQALPAGVLNPALIALKAIKIVILYQETPVTPDNPLLAGLNARAERKLIESDPRLASFLQTGYNAGLPNTPVLKFNIYKINLSLDSPPVFCVQTTLSADVPVELNPGIFLNINLWAKADTIQAPNSAGEVAAVNFLIFKHIDAFVSDFSIANAPPLKPAEPNSVTPKTPPKNEPKAQDKILPPTENTAAQAGYVASKSSIIFHKLDCTFVKSILPANRVYYKTRDEAVTAGKKPCKKCQP
jgi:hypothetical protein